MNVLEKKITVQINQGVHGRVATGLAQIAQQHNVRLFILLEEETLDCSSVLDVLTMGFAFGMEVKFRALGEDADSAIKAVEKLLAVGDEP